MEERPPFHYVPQCSSAGCGKPAVFKIAAPWSNGTSHELKNYGLACEDHRTSLLAVARLHRGSLSVADGETLGTVGLYTLEAGRRDVALRRLPDHG